MNLKKFATVVFIPIIVFTANAETLEDMKSEYARLQEKEETKQAMLNVNYDEQDELKQEIAALDSRLSEAFVDIDKDAGIVLPKTAEFSDATSKIVYDDVTNDTVGTIEYTYAGHEVGKADIVKTNVQVPEYKFSNQTDVSEETQTEEAEHVSKIQIRMSTIITVVVVVLVLLVLGIIIKKVADNFYIIKHNFEVRKEHKRLFKREKKRNKRRRRRR